VSPRDYLNADPALEWRGSFENDELNALHAEGFEHPLSQDDWWTRSIATALDGRARDCQEASSAS
jgi:hypothetical protein